jgi:hypothetical protein
MAFILSLNFRLTSLSGSAPSFSKSFQDVTSLISDPLTYMESLISLKMMDSFLVGRSAGGVKEPNKPMLTSETLLAIQYDY